MSAYPDVGGDPTPSNRWLEGKVPGEAGIWIFILGDMVMFSVFFIVFLSGRMDQPELFAHSRTELTQAFGAVNMVVLLTSSLLVALAVRAQREGRGVHAGRLLGWAAVCALAFLAIKGTEYGLKLHHGINPGTNEFFMYFFIFTGIHALHVIIGLGVLLLLRHVARRPEPKEHDQRLIETGASYWHMVDLLWVVLFPLLYLAS